MYWALVVLTILSPLRQTVLGTLVPFLGVGALDPKSPLRWQSERDPVASEKLAHTFNVFEHLLPDLIAFSRIRCQPLAAGHKQVFKGVTDSRVGIKVLPSDHANSSVITVCSPLVIAANGVAQTHEQGLQKKSVSGGHSETHA
jgi:hypothetical protein